MNPTHPSQPALDLGATVRALRQSDVVFERYALMAEQGRGGMSVVWRARDISLEREVALKFLPEVVAVNPAALADLKREALRSLQLTHPNIVRIHDFVVRDGMAAICMEFVPGETLARMKSDSALGVLSPADVRAWLPQALAALDYAHRGVGVVHRDLKPANLMLTPQGTLKILDFGIAASLSETTTQLTSQSWSGTLLYMSPQQLRGRAPTTSDDVYALGATLYELLSGKPPFTRGDITHQIFNELPSSIAERRRELGITAETPPVPPNWEETILACLAKEPAGRPQSVDELARRLALPALPSLHQAVTSAPTTVVPPTLPGAAQLPAAGAPALASPSAPRAAAPLPPVRPAARAVPAVPVGEWIARIKRVMLADDGAILRRLLIGLALALFAGSLLLPGYDSNQSGFECFVMSLSILRSLTIDSAWKTLFGSIQESTPVSQSSHAPALSFFIYLAGFGLANLAFLIGAGLGLWRRSWPKALAGIVVGAAAYVCLWRFWNGGLGPQAQWWNTGVRSGYYVWVAAFVVLAAVYVRDARLTRSFLSGAQERRQRRVFKIAGLAACGWLVFAAAMIGVNLARTAHRAKHTPPTAGDAWTVPNLGLQMTWVPAGEFVMGSPVSEPGRDADEGPQTRVVIREGFWIGQFKVTRDEWQRVMGKPAPGNSADGARVPVARVSWSDALGFCQKLTTRERAAQRLPDGYEYELPTEAQWEYASRAGSADVSSNSGTDSNAWDLHAMLTGVAEWCIDSYSPRLPGGIVSNPVRLTVGDHHVVRGPGRSAQRRGVPPVTEDGSIGFRVVLRKVAGLTNVADRDMLAQQTTPAMRFGELRGGGGTTTPYPLMSEESRKKLTDALKKMPHHPTPPTASNSTLALASSTSPQPGSPWTVPELSLAMPWIAPGTFVMGSPDNEPNRERDEGPQTQVQIPRGFWLSCTEVTQQQWRALMGTTVRQQFEKVGHGALHNEEGADLPMTWVSWHEAAEFCRVLTQKERDAGRLPPGYRYALPTEAQWEFACRAGTRTPFAGPLDTVGWVETERTSPVARKQPNAWGLFDVHGNISEWCDTPHAPYPGGSVIEPLNLTSNSPVMVFRGGNWFHPAHLARSAARGNHDAEFRTFWLGFRIALVTTRSAR